VTPASPEGVVGCEVVGDIELLAKDPFLWFWRAMGGCDVSFNQDARRTGFGGWAGGGKLSWRLLSGSSSELAIASESGVDLLFSLSNRIAWVLGGPAGKLPCPGLD
jgi:hypothetical protein